jgi:hypothetical protein
MLCGRFSHGYCDSHQGSLLKVVLDDYLRLKGLFAARLVTKSTSQGDHSSVTEVGSERQPVPHHRCSFSPSPLEGAFRTAVLLFLSLTTRWRSL